MCQKGVSLLEVLLVVFIGGILLAATGELYQKFLQVHKRQEVLIQAERELAAVEQSFAQLVGILPGRGIAAYDETAGRDAFPKLPLFEIPSLKPFRLGVITPLKIAGNDGFVILYASRGAPRLELIADSEVYGKDGRGRATAVDSSDGYHEHDLVLLVGRGSVEEGLVARVVRLKSLAKVGAAAELIYDLCGTGSCGVDLPQLRNVTPTINFAAGSAVIKPKLSVVYAVRRADGLYVFRNEGGVLAYDLVHGVVVRGGKDSLIGKLDGMSIEYVTDTGIYSTPILPDEKWIDTVRAVRVKLSRKLFLDRAFSERIKVIEFPVVAKQLE
ncbi:MAG: prepilin-type N-terminal cleavage/methylation domain-containing protein [Acidobacteriota bacterium]|nr:prepilin-type N-terminal cleavage/methylation domain-containing protein [Blastocatellia bacterium]MDW8411686.1 prepilin-type N-terminal cleavage/methylation domain-containing protein [Acidobacteriota bacterium]